MIVAIVFTTSFTQNNKLKSMLKLFLILLFNIIKIRY